MPKRMDERLLSFLKNVAGHPPQQIADMFTLLGPREISGKADDHCSFPKNRTRMLVSRADDAVADFSGVCHGIHSIEPSARGFEANDFIL
jgi:hypothetical protein